MSGVQRVPPIPGGGRPGWVVPAVAVMLPCGALGWFLYFVLFRTTPGQDWMVFDTAAQAWFRGDPALLLDGARFTSVLNATHSWLAVPLKFHPWVYPPYTLLLALPFGLLPWWANYAVFQGLSLAGFVAALSLWAPPGRRWVFILGVLGCAATAFTFGSGQNSFLTAGLVTGGIWLMHRRGVAAGVLLGLLAFKQQLAVLVPVALAAAGAWRAMAAAAVTVAVLLAGSLVVPGVAMWQAWLHLLLGGDPAFHNWVNEGRLHGQSVFTCAVVAGVSEHAANLLQLAAMGISALCVFVAFARQSAPPRQLAVLLCGMILAAPHVGNYDAIMLGEAAMLVLVGSGFVPGAGMAALAVAVWCALSFQPPFVITAAAVTPVLVAGLMVGCLARGRQGLLF